MIGMWGFYNRGCEAIVRGTAEILRQIVPDIQLAVGIGDLITVEADKKRLSDLSMPIYPLVKKDLKINASIIRRLAQYAYYRCTGSTALYCYRKPLGYCDREWDLALEVGGDTFVDYPILNLQHDMWLMKKGLRVGLWGMNLGHLKSSFLSPRKLKEIYAHYTLITVRDAFSLRYLSDLGVGENVFRMADPAFEMPMEPWDIYSCFPQRNWNKVIGLNLSPVIAKVRKGGKADVTRLVVETTKKLNHYGFEVLLIPHCFPPGASPNDDDLNVLMPAYEQLLSQHADVDILTMPLNAPQIKYVISKCQVFAGARMHATIAAWSTGVPTVSISYSQKSLNLNDEIYENRQFVVNGETCSSDELSTVILEMADNLDAARKSTQNGVARLRAFTESFIANQALGCSMKRLQHGHISSSCINSKVALPG